MSHQGQTVLAVVSKMDHKVLWVETESQGQGGSKSSGRQFGPDSKLLAHLCFSHCFDEMLWFESCCQNIKTFRRYAGLEVSAQMTQCAKLFKKYFTTKIPSCISNTHTVLCYLEFMKDYFSQTSTVNERYNKLGAAFNENKSQIYFQSYAHNVLNKQMHVL